MNKLNFWWIGFIALVLLVIYATNLPQGNSSTPVGTASAAQEIQPSPTSVPVDHSAEIQACIQQANDTYTQSWNNNCQSNYNDCMSSGHISQAQCYQWWGGSCALGNTVAAQYSLDLQRNKNDCYREY